MLACAEEVTTSELAATWGEGASVSPSSFLNLGEADGAQLGNGVKCAYVPAPADQFKGMVGAEFTEMLQYFAEFGCTSLPSTSPLSL